MPSAGQKGLFLPHFPVPFVRFGRNLSTGKDKTMRKIETKKLAAAVTALALCAGVLTGCGGVASRHCIQHRCVCRFQRSEQRGG